MDNVQWGSFLCGAIAGWWVCLISRNQQPERDFVQTMFGKLKEGHSVHMSISVIDEDGDFRRDNEDDDDDGDGDTSPTNPSYDWSRN